MSLTSCPYVLKITLVEEGIVEHFYTNAAQRDFVMNNLTLCFGLDLCKDIKSTEAIDLRGHRNPTTSLRHQYFPGNEASSSSVCDPLVGKAESGLSATTRLAPTGVSGPKRSESQPGASTLGGRLPSSLPAPFQLQPPSSSDRNEKRLEKESLCSVCSSKKAHHMIRPCIHYPFCFKCLLKIMDEDKPTCPVCLKEVLSYCNKS